MMLAGENHAPALVTKQSSPLEVVLYLRLLPHFPRDVHALVASPPGQDHGPVSCCRSVVAAFVSG